MEMKTAQQIQIEQVPIGYLRPGPSMKRIEELSRAGIGIAGHNLYRFKHGKPSVQFPATIHSSRCTILLLKMANYVMEHGCLRLVLQANLVVLNNRLITNFHCIL